MRLMGWGRLVGPAIAVLVFRIGLSYARVTADSSIYKDSLGVCSDSHCSDFPIVAEPVLSPSSFANQLTEPPQVVMASKSQSQQLSGSGWRVELSENWDVCIRPHI